LRRLIGIESEETVPKKWNLSRFLEVLGGSCEPLEVKKAIVEHLGRTYK
jgi:hypothetical protein